MGRSPRLALALGLAAALIVSAYALRPSVSPSGSDVPGTGPEAPSGHGLPRLSVAVPAAGERSQDPGAAGGLSADPVPAPPPHLRVVDVAGSPLSGVRVAVWPYDQQGLRWTADTDADGRVSLARVDGQFCGCEFRGEGYALAQETLWARGEVTVTLGQGCRIFLGLREADRHLVGQTAEVRLDGYSAQVRLDSLLTELGRAQESVEVLEVGGVPTAHPGRITIVPSAGSVTIPFEGRERIHLTMEAWTAPIGSPAGVALTSAGRWTRSQLEPVPATDRAQALEAHVEPGEWLILAADGPKAVAQAVAVTPSPAHQSVRLEWRPGCRLTVRCRAALDAASARAYVLALGDADIHSALGQSWYWAPDPSPGILDLAAPSKPLPGGRLWPGRATATAGGVQWEAVPQDSLLRLDFDMPDHGHVALDVRVPAEAQHLEREVHPAPSVRILAVRPTGPQSPGPDPLEMVLSPLDRSGAARTAGGTAIQLPESGSVRVFGLRDDAQYRVRIAGYDVWGEAEFEAARVGDVRVDLQPVEWTERAVRVEVQGGSDPGGIHVLLFDPAGPSVRRWQRLSDAEGVVRALVPQGTPLKAQCVDPWYVGERADVPIHGTGTLVLKPAGAISIENAGAVREIAVAGLPRDVLGRRQRVRMAPGSAWRIARVPVGTYTLVISADSGGSEAMRPVATAVVGVEAGVTKRVRLP